LCPGVYRRGVDAKTPGRSAAGATETHAGPAVRPTPHTLQPPRPNPCPSPCTSTVAYVYGYAGGERLAATVAEIPGPREALARASDSSTPRPIPRLSRDGSTQPAASGYGRSQTHDETRDDPRQIATMPGGRA